MSPDMLVAACRFVHDSALMALWGAFAYLAAMVPPRLAEPIAATLAPFRLAATGLALLATLLLLPLQAAIIGDGWQDAINPQTLIDIVAGTSVGTAWLAQLAGVLVLALAQWRPRRHGPAKTAAAAALALASLAAGGHAVMDDGWRAILHPLNDILHVLSAGAWFGALLPLPIVLARFGETASRADATIALRRFSTAGHWAVALAILSGVANSFFIVGWPLGWSPAYRLLLTAKIAVVLGMTGIAILNRYWFVPRFGRGRGQAIAAIRIGTLIEIGLGLAAILLVSIFGMLDPLGAD